MSEKTATYQADDTITPSDVLARHRPAMIGGHTAGCLVCLGTRPWPCDAYLMARQLVDLASRLLSEGDTGI